MLEHPQRVEQFKGEIAEMKLPDQASGRDRTLLRVGAVLMAVGVVLAPVAYAMSHGTTNPLQQRDALVLAITGLVLAVVGGALFVRYSVAQFLRFWLARLSWEQQAQTDRVVDAIQGEGGGTGPGSTTGTGRHSAGGTVAGAGAGAAGSASGGTEPGVGGAVAGDTEAEAQARHQVDTTA
ncbi:MAG TPA: hypothetical protein VHK88_15090 [Aquihabitans sp.]|jgi:hypothetical protein|nr:hypothetical protein [Aquihabitans sp.]